MPRRLRHIPEPGTLVEVTCRVIHGRKLLKPNRPLNEMIAGTLARGKRRYGVRICAVAFLSNHGGLFHVPGKYWERDDDEWHRLVVASLIGHEWLRLMALTA